MSPESRENWKLRLEIFKTILQIITLISIGFAYLSYRDSVSKVDQDTYKMIAANWNDHLALFIEHPNLRPYFFEGRAVTPNNKDKLLIESVAVVRLDKMDAILTFFAQRRAPDKAILGWKTTFADAFRRSPALCEAISGVEGNYGLIVPIAQENCTMQQTR
ncbi:hypothetical protein MMA231_02451 [Asticcacaulis sp. MM231]|uniref:hypothetical protein n=1 Tax=Asticcacaulis sp. MM231 TaxID=3157666 RepID=UPI0032D59300